MKNSIIVLLFILAFGVTLATVLNASNHEKCRNQHVLNVVEIDETCPEVENDDN